MESPSIRPGPSRRRRGEFPRTWAAVAVQMSQVGEMRCNCKRNKQTPIPASTVIERTHWPGEPSRDLQNPLHHIPSDFLLLHLFFLFLFFGQNHIISLSFPDIPKMAKDGACNTQHFCSDISQTYHENQPDLRHEKKPTRVTNYEVIVTIVPLSTSCTLYPSHSTYVFPYHTTGTTREPPPRFPDNHRSPKRSFSSN